MSKLSLQSLEQYQLLQQRAPTSGDAAAFLSGLKSGQVVQAQVIQSLGDSLFTLKFADLSVITQSATPLTPGQRLTLEVRSNPNGRPNLSVLTATDGTIAQASERPANLPGRPAVPTSPNTPSTSPSAPQGNPQALAQIVPGKGQSNAAVQGAAGSTGGIAATKAQLASSLLELPTDLATSTGQTTGSGSALAQVGPAVIRQFQSILEGGDTGTANPSAISPKLAALLKPDGPVARLLEKRPDLAPRLETLLTEFQQRPGGLGKGIDQLTDSLNRLIQAAPGDQKSALSTTQNRLVSQILGSGNLDQPEQLAQQLASRIGQLVRGFEGTLARALPEATPPIFTDAALIAGQQASFSSLESLTSPSSNAASLSAQEQNAVAADTADTSRSGAELKGEQATRSFEAAAARLGQEGSGREVTASTTTSAGHIVRGTFESDLKGQLLELRSQLQTLADSRPDQASNAQQAVNRVDAILNQVTAQQVRNVEGLNQFLYAELPIDPKSGIQEARLQVFYRNQGAAKASDNDRFTVALFLNLSKLGDVLAVVSEVDKAVTVGFTVENPTARNLLSGQTELLRNALVKGGHAGATVTVRAPAKPEGIPVPGTKSDDEIWKSFLDAGPITGNPGGRLNLEA